MVNLAFSQVAFLKSATNLAQSPRDGHYEVAFVGRSNAGKSSALNALAGKVIARHSKTPGRTQLINFFTLAHYRLVDLPGYGFAKVPVEVQKRLSQMLSTYLQERKGLCGLVLLMDIRHPFQPSDETLLSIAQERSLPVHILLTKSDKLSRGACQTILAQAKKRFLSVPSITIQCFSATKGVGVQSLQAQIITWFKDGLDPNPDLSPS